MLEPIMNGPLSLDRIHYNTETGVPYTNEFTIHADEVYMSLDNNKSPLVEKFTDDIQGEVNIQLISRNQFANQFEVLIKFVAELESGGWNDYCNKKVAMRFSTIDQQFLARELTMVERTSEFRNSPKFKCYVNMTFSAVVYAKKPTELSDLLIIKQTNIEYLNAVLENPSFEKYKPEILKELYRVV